MWKSLLAKGLTIIDSLHLYTLKVIHSHALAVWAYAYIHTNTNKHTFSLLDTQTKPSPGYALSVQLTLTSSCVYTVRERRDKRERETGPENSCSIVSIHVLQVLYKSMVCWNHQPTNDLNLNRTPELGTKQNPPIFNGNSAVAVLFFFWYRGLFNILWHPLNESHSPWNWS